MTDYTPTDTDIRDGFSLNYARDYEDFSDGYYEACRFGEQAFSRWLEEHDRQVAEKAYEEAKRDLEMGAYYDRHGR